MAVDGEAVDAQHRRAGANARQREFSPHGRDRRAEIIVAAQTLLAANGYAATRMRDIATAAGVTKGLLYWYFDSKEALIAEILRDARRQLRDAQRDAVRHIQDPLERVYVATAVAVRFVLSNYRLYQLSQLSEDPGRGVARVLSESTQVHARDTTATIREGQRLGVIRSTDSAAAIAYANSGVVNHMCSNAFYGNLPGSIDDVAHAAARYVVRACAANEALAAEIEARQSPTPKVRSNGVASSSVRGG